MSNIDYDNIKFQQFLELLPVLSVWPVVDLFLPELLFTSFPVLDEEEGGAIKHVISGYRDEDDSLIIQPLGVIEGHEHPGLNMVIGHTDFVSEQVCLLSGRVTENNRISFSTIQGCLDWDESHEVLPFDIQKAGVQVLEKVFRDQHFFRTRIGDRYYLTTVIETQEDEPVKNNPFTTVAPLTEPPM